MRAAPGSIRRALVGLAVVAVLLALAADLPAAQKKRRKAARKPEPTAVPRPPDPNRVTISTADGVTLAATWRPIAWREGAPAVLLLHDFSRDRRQWDELAPELNALGLATLAIDFRAHGESLRKSGTSASLRLSPRLQTDPNALPRDVEAAGAWLRSRSPRVGAIGLSLGGNLAILASASGWVDAAVVVSANTDRLAALAGRRPVTPKGVLAIASEQDPGRAKSARALDESGLAPKKLLIYPGSAHNLVLFAERPEAKQAALAWLVELLGATPPPTPTPTPPPTPTPTAFVVPTEIVPPAPTPDPGR